MEEEKPVSQKGTVDRISIKSGSIMVAFAIGTQIYSSSLLCNWSTMIDQLKENHFITGWISVYGLFSFATSYKKPHSARHFAFFLFSFFYRGFQYVVLVNTGANLIRYAIEADYTFSNGISVDSLWNLSGYLICLSAYVYAFYDYLSLTYFTKIKTAELPIKHDAAEK
jgi:hypothetical protein